jgi:hypothetical protein
MLKKYVAIMLLVIVSIHLPENPEIPLPDLQLQVFFQLFGILPAFVPLLQNLVVN